MELTPQEQRVCDVFSRRDGTGRVHCYECPLVIKTEYCACKRNLTEEEYEYYGDDER